MPNQSTSSLNIARGEVFSALSDIAHAMATPARLRIIQILSNRPSSVDELSGRIGESIANTSQHLQKLKKAGMVSDSRLGLKRTYSLTNPIITDAFLQFQVIASNIMPRAQAAEEELCPTELRPDLTLDGVLKDVRLKKAVLIDVRDREEFEATPAPMAIFFRRDQIKNSLDLLSKKKPVYAFCRGRYCYLANDVVRDLRKRGYLAYRLSEMSHEIAQKIKESEGS